MKDLQGAAAVQPAAAFSDDLNGGGGSTSSAGILPLIDPAVLLDLEEQLGDASLARSFAEDFIEATYVRVSKLEAAVASQDAEEAMGAILGAKTTSMMVGAVRLAHLATECVAILRRGNFAGVALVLAEIRACAEQTTALLRENLLHS